MIEFNKQKSGIKGEIKCQGDEDISIFSILLSSLAKGKSKIFGLLESSDVLNLIDIMKQFGVSIEKDTDAWIINGNGLNSMKEPVNVLDINSSEKILKLLIGYFSSYNFKLFFSGNDNIGEFSLENIFAIFKGIGISFNARNNINLPFVMDGNTNKKQLEYTVKEYNYILKDLLLLSCIAGNKNNIVEEKEKTRNHLEILMKFFGIKFEEHEIGNRGGLTTKIGTEIDIAGGQEFSGRDIIVPSDISFSAFIAAVALLTPDSDIILKNILMNQHRDAFYRTLIDMGADIKFINQRIICGEKVADINVKYSELRDTIIPENRVYKMCYEYPILVLISAITKANIEIQGTKNIKLEHLENYSYMISVLKSLGVSFKEESNSLKIFGHLEKNAKFDETLINNIDNSNLLFTTGLFGLFMEKSISIPKSVENDFPELSNFLGKIGINIK